MTAAKWVKLEILGLDDAKINEKGLFYLCFKSHWPKLAELYLCTEHETKRGMPLGLRDANTLRQQNGIT